MPDALRSLLSALPKAELHLHLLGAMPQDVLLNQARKYSPRELMEHMPERHVELFRRYANTRPFLAPGPRTPEIVAGLFRYDDFHHFLITFAFTEYLFRRREDLWSLVSGVIEGLRRQSIAYAEITVNAFGYVRRGIPLEEVISCLDEGAKAPGIRVQWIVDLVRDFGADKTLELLHQLAAVRVDSIVGITLGGSEHLYPPELFGDLYAAAQDLGFRATVHAGEGLGAESVWRALELPGIERIGHGVRAMEDPALVQHLAERGLPLEVCPTSNLRTGIYPTYEAHPLRALFDAGVALSINSDDPAFFGTTLVDEYLYAQSMGLSFEDLRAVLRNAYAHAFLPGDEKAVLLAAFDEWWRREAGH